MIRLFRYVAHERVPDFLRCGWIARDSLLGTHHGDYSVLCEWLCKCPVPIPQQ